MIMVTGEKVWVNWEKKYWDKNDLGRIDVWREKKEENRKKNGDRKNGGNSVFRRNREMSACYEKGLWEYGSRYNAICKREKKIFEERLVLKNVHCLKSIKKIFTR